MKKCVKIVCNFEETPDAKAKKLLVNIGDRARDLELEGFAQVVGASLKIVAAGSNEAIESLIDLLHKEAFHAGMSSIEVEPFIKDRDYRGIFRIIE